MYLTCGLYSGDVIFIILVFLSIHPPENNKPPVADAGPEKELTLPVDRTTLDGSKSSDDQKIATYHWKQTRSVRHRLMPQQSLTNVTLQSRNYLFHYVAKTAKKRIVSSSSEDVLRLLPNVILQKYWIPHFL